MSEGTTLAVVVMGEEALTIECAALVLRRGHSLAAVVTSDAQVRERALQLGAPVIDVADDWARQLAGLDFDMFVSAANFTIVPTQVLDMARRCAVNFHDGPLPRHAGSFATSWAILQRESSHGIAWHAMTEEVDGGDLLVTRDFPIPEDATAYDLNRACFDAGIEAFTELLDAVAEDRLTGRPQRRVERTFHCRYDGPPHGGLIDWTAAATDLQALVRATDLGPHRNDFGSALLLLAQDVVVVRRAVVRTSTSTARPGTVTAVTQDGVAVQTGDGELVMTAVETLDARVLSGSSLETTFTPHRGRCLPQASDYEQGAIEDRVRAMRRRERAWRKKLISLEPLLPPQLGQSVAPPPAWARAVTTSGSPAMWAGLAGALALLARLAQDGGLDVGVTVAKNDVPGLAQPVLPMRLPEQLWDLTLPVLATMLEAEVDRLHRDPGCLGDLGVRDPLCRATRLPVLVQMGSGGEVPAAAAAIDHDLVLTVDAKGEVTFSGPRLTSAESEWLAHRAHLLSTRAGTAPDARIGRIDLLLEGEEALGAGDGFSCLEPTRCRTISELVDESVRAVPEATAVVADDVTLSYLNLHHRVQLLSGALVARGIGPGDTVGVYLERSSMLVVALLAVMRTGAAYLPLDPIYPSLRVREMVTDAGAALVLTEPALRSDMDDLQVVDTLEVGDVDGAQALGKWPYPDPESTAYVVYTSGSSGRPKGVEVPHRALSNFLQSMAQAPGFTAEDSLAAVTTVCFDIAALELFLPLMCRGHVIVVPRDIASDGVRLRRLVEEHRPSVLQATPTTWRMLLATGWAGSPEMRALCGGEALGADLASQLVGRVAALYNMYGPTETTIWSTFDQVTASGPVTIGKPIANTRCHVLDARREPVPPGVPGELFIGGSGVAAGYRGRPKLTAQRFLKLPGLEERAYRTGDIVRRLPDGRLQYLERRDGQIKLRGYRIELGEVEAVLRELPEVRDAVAVLREDEPGLPCLVAYVTSASEGVADQVRSALGGRLPDYMVPQQVVQLSHLPTTANGKIDRVALPAPPRRSSTGSGRGLTTDLEHQIASAWREILDVEEIGPEDNFFDVGGNSFTLTVLSMRLRALGDRDVSRIDILSNPTVRALARHIAGAADAPFTSRAGRVDRSALNRRRILRGS